MLFVTLGAQASASTWIFNVVRKLVANRYPNARSLYVEDGLTVLQCLHPDIDCLLVKAHSVDPALMNLVAATGGKIIVSTRDPRDILVSMQERFGQDYASTLHGVSKSLACIASIYNTIPVLHLDYEESFHLRPDTIQTIAEFLNIPLSDDEATAIFESLRPEDVKAYIEALPSSKLEQAGSSAYDLPTLWHPNHLGDGLSKKWMERLPPYWQNMAATTLLPISSGDHWRTENLVWPAAIFHPLNGGEDLITANLPLSGSGTLLCWGPYMHLPLGRWRIRPILDSVSMTRQTVKFDVFMPSEQRGIIECKTVTLPNNRGDDIYVDFDVLNYLEPIEMRLYNSRNGAKGVIGFRGAILQYLGPCDEDFSPIPCSVEN